MFHLHHRIRFDDVDGAGLVYYPRFFHFCHTALEDLFNLHGPVSYATFIGQRRRGFPTVHAQADFIRPARYGQVLDVAMAVEKMGRSSLTLGYALAPLEGPDGTGAPGPVCARLSVTTVYTDLDRLVSVVLDNDVRAVLEQVVGYASTA